MLFRSEITRVLEIIEKAGVLNLLNNDKDPDWGFLLLYALAAHQLEQADWKEPFIRIINFCPRQEILVKAYEYLQNQGEIILSEDEPVAFLARGRYHYAKNEYSLALKYLSEIDPPYSSLLLRELAGSYSGAGRSREGAEYLLSLLPRVQEEEISILLAEAGFLYRRAGFYRDAVDVFSRAWGITTDVSIKDRMAWYSLDCSMKVSIFEGAKALQKWQKQWNNPSYFNDLLEAYAERLVREGGWKTLESIYKEGSSFWDPAVVSKYSFLLARGYSQGYLVPETPQKGEELLRMVMLEDSAPYYYKILAAYLLKERIGRDFFVLDQNPLSSPETQKDLTLVEGFLSYSLPLRSYALMMENLAPYPEDLIHRTIGACRDKGYYYESLRLAYRAFHRGKITPSEQNLPLLYPLAFSKEIEKAASTEELSLPLILALVREESFFSPTIVSRSGAVGLCQIMPLTATDISRRLGLKTYSLEDPSDNLTLGAWYLGSQFRRFNSLVPALWAYNAGPTRAREWLKLWGTLDPFLLPETTPFPETKEYVKKIPVSSVFYSLIYNLDSPERILNNFFPGGV